MESILNYFSRNKVLSTIICMIIGVILGFSLENENFTNARSLLSLMLSVGGVGVLLLHAKAFFSEKLNNSYTRAYGFFFVLLYSSGIFFGLTFIIGQQNIFFNKIAYSTILGMSIYNYITNNYAGIEEKHYLAKILLKKQEDKEKNKSDH